MTTAETLEHASQSLDNGKYSDAEVRLKALLQKHGDNAEAWWLLGRVSLARYRYADAVEQFSRARDNGAGPDKVAVPMATALLAQHQYNKALDTLAAVHASDDEQRAQVSVLIGSAHRGLGQFDEAGAAFKKALAAVPDFAPALVGQAKIARDTGNMARAQALLDRATQTTPDYAPAWLTSGWLGYDHDNCDRAAPAFAKLLSMDHAGTPNQLFQARSYLADCELRVGEMDKAKQNIGILLKQGPNSAFANYLQALVNIRERDYEQAARHLQRVLSASPNNVRSLTLLASIKLAQNDTSNAETYLNQALSRLPSDVPALRLLASIYIQRDQYDRAIRMLENAYSKNPDSDGLRTLLAQAMASRKDDDGKTRGGGLVASDASLRIDVATSMARAGNTAAALALLEGFTPKNPDEKLRAAAVRISIDLRNQHPDQALASAQKLVAEAPDDPFRLRLLARIYSAIGKNGEAGQALDRALKIEPKDEELLLMRAAVFGRQGGYADAQQAVERVLAQDASDLRAQMAMAQIAAAQGEQAQALSWLEKAHTSHPKNSQLAVKLIQAYLATHQTADALTLANRLVSADSENAAFNRMQGIALLAEGKKNDAINSLSKAAKLAPDQPAYRLDLAQAQISAQDRDGALKQLQRLRSEHPKFLPAAGVLARLQAQMGNGDAALKTVDDISVDPENRASIDALKGQILAAQGKYKRAADAYASAYRARPEQSLAVALFAARRQAGIEKPEASLVDWLERKPGDTAVTLQLAQWYQSNGQNEAAERSYHDLLAVDENNPVALNNLALIRSQLGHNDALGYARRAHKVAPDNAAIADTLGWLLVNGGQTAQGVVLLRKAAGALPDEPGIQYHLAFGLDATGDEADKAQAQKILERILQADAKFSDRKSAQALRARLQGTKTDA